MYTDNTSYKTFGYTFASPNTTTAKNAATYKNIFNIVNKDDIIPYLPLKEWGFTNYGVTKSVSVRELYSYEPGFFGKEKASTMDKMLSKVTTIVAIVFAVLVVVMYMIQGL